MRDNLVVAVRGTGVAAACFHALLGAAGVGVQMEVTDRPRVPAVMLSPATQALLSDVGWLATREAPFGLGRFRLNGFDLERASKG